MPSYCPSKISAMFQCGVGDKVISGDRRVEKDPIWLALETCVDRLWNLSTFVDPCEWVLRSSVSHVIDRLRDLRSYDAGRVPKAPIFRTHVLSKKLCLRSSIGQSRYAYEWRVA